MKLGMAEQKAMMTPGVNNINNASATRVFAEACIWSRKLFQHDTHAGACSHPNLSSVLALASPRINSSFSAHATMQSEANC